MSKIQAAITGVHGYVPEKILSNKDLESIVDTSDDWITRRTGIKERRILAKDKPTSFMAIKACEGLLSKTNTKPEEIDLVLCATMTPDMLTPSVSNIISKELNIRNAFAFDIQAACSGFLYTMITAEKFIISGQCKKVLVVGADKMSYITNYNDRTTCILFGDGAGAILMEPNLEGYGIKDSILRSDSEHGLDLLKIEAGGSKNPCSHETIDQEKHYIKQEGRNVYKYAVEEMFGASKEIMNRNNITSDDLAYLIPHQANERILESVAEKLKLPKEKVMITINKYGNTTAATLPLCLWDYESKLTKGDNLVFTVFGAGFTWGAAYVKWAY
ncbi:MAG: ketoacyl-ACP synthase III [Bacteroidetes bacterium]|nr:ketoacyl-ACP synthase III [Bacteroidota bacterium]